MGEETILSPERSAGLPILDERKLRKLMDSDFRAYQRELLRPWSGMSADMKDLMTMISAEREICLIEDADFRMMVRAFL